MYEAYKKIVRAAEAAELVWVHVKCKTYMQNLQANYKRFLNPPSAFHIDNRDRKFAHYGTIQEFIELDLKGPHSSHRRNPWIGTRSISRAEKNVLLAYLRPDIETL